MPSTAPISELTEHLGYWLRCVSNGVSQSFARKVQAHGVTVAEWVVLRQLLDEKALAPSELAERMGMTRGAISKLADRLVAKALMARHAHASDGRAQSLSLTAAGRRLVPVLAALADANDAEFFGHLKSGERLALSRILRGIVTQRGLKSPPID